MFASWGYIYAYQYQLFCSSLEFSEVAYRCGMSCAVDDIARHGWRMQHHVPPFIVEDYIKYILANQVRALDGSAVGELDACFRAEGSGEMPFRGLGSSLAEEEHVVF